MRSMRKSETWKNKLKNFRKKWKVCEKVRESESYEKKWDEKSERFLSKRGIYEKKCENYENIDIWGKVRDVLKFWVKVRGVRKRGKSVEIMRKSERCEKKWDMWEKVRHVWKKVKNVRKSE